MNVKNEINETKDQNGQNPDQQQGKPNSIKTILLVGAVLIMAVVLVNNLVIARTPAAPAAAQAGSPVAFTAPMSCCARDQSQNSIDLIGQQALVYYSSTFGEEAEEAAVEDYGCHQEVVVFKDGRPIRRLAYNSGVFSDLGPISDEIGS